VVGWRLPRTRPENVADRGWRAAHCARMRREGAGC